MSTLTLKQLKQIHTGYSRRISPARLREFPSGPLDCGPVQRFTDCLKPNFKKLTNNQEYEPVPYIMISQLFFSNSIFV